MDDETRKALAYIIDKLHVLETRQTLNTNHILSSIRENELKGEHLSRMELDKIKVLEEELHAALKGEEKLLAMVKQIKDTRAAAFQR